VGGLNDYICLIKEQIPGSKMEQQLAAAPHHDVLALLVQVTVLLFAARALGELARRMGQPTIVGEILAGVILGPSLLSGLIPSLGDWLIPQTETQGYLLEQVSMMGAMFMMLIAGLEIDLMLIRRQSRSAIGTGIGGLIVPFAGGFLLAQWLPDTLLTDPQHRLVFSLFVATAISASAIPVAAKVLMELNLIRRDSSQVIISAAMMEDAAAWIILSVVVGLSEGATVNAAQVGLSIGNVLIFVLFSFTIGWWIVKRSLSFVQNEVKIPDAMFSLVVVLMFGWGAFSQALHLEAVIGAFVVGILLGQIRNVPNDAIHKLEGVGLSIFAPIFFAVAGLRINLLHLLKPHLMGVALLTILVASVTKIGGAYLGARLVGRRNHWTALSIGVGLNVHGAVEIIIATIGLTKGVLTQDMFTIIVLMSLVTSLIAPTALRRVLARVQPEQQEIDRLHREELVRDNPFAHVRRVLLPVRRREDDRGGPIQTIEASILGHVARKSRLALTLLNIASNGERTRSIAFLEKLARLFPPMEVSRKVLVSQDPTNVILDEAKKNYDLLVMGAAGETGGTEILFNPLVDSVVRLSPCPSIVVHSDTIPPDWAPRRILAPTNGSLASRRAVQAAFSLAAGGESEEGEVLILKVVNMEAAMCYLDRQEAILERQYIIAHQIVDELGAMGHSLGVRTYTAVQPGPDPESVILEVARESQIDLIVLGTNVRAGSERLYLGSRVERILHNAPCPVIVVNSV
jgi:Kef-type K+ transport system membrane component KefB/nucleotide-binding universal stress UspA family protein